MKSLSRHLNESFLNEADSKIREYNKYRDTNKLPEWHKAVRLIPFIEEKKIVTYIPYKFIDDFVSIAVSYYNSPEINPGSTNKIEYEIGNLVKRYWEEHIDIKHIPWYVICGMINDILQKNSFDKLFRNIAYMPWALKPEEIKNYTCYISKEYENYVPYIYYNSKKHNSHGLGYNKFQTEDEAFYFIKEGYWKKHLGNTLFQKYKNLINIETEIKNK